MNKYGQLCYTYYLYHVPTGKKYYGSRVANKCAPELDLWNKYFSSSDLVEALIKEYGRDSFQPFVKKVFETIEAARYWEDRVLHKLDVIHKDEWLNQAYASGPFYGIVPKGINLGNDYGKANKGKKRTNEMKEFKRQQQKQWCAEHPEMWNEDTKQIAGTFSDKRWNRTKGILDFLLRNRWDLNSSNLAFILPHNRDGRTKLPAVQLFPFISKSEIYNPKQYEGKMNWFSLHTIKMSCGGHGYTKKTH
jgi:hypothetical protein